MGSQLKSRLDCQHLPIRAPAAVGEATFAATIL
jgi:hypothetical protein